MHDEDLLPHVDDIMSVLGERASVNREQVFEELRKYLTVFRLDLVTAKRTIVKRFGGASGALPAGNAKKLGEIAPGEMSVSFVGKLISANEKEIESRGVRKRIVYGLIGDETATLPYTIWDIPGTLPERGDTVSVRNAYATEYQGRVQLNFGSRTAIRKESGTEIRTEDIPFGPARRVKIGDIADMAGPVEVTGRILSIEKRILGGEGAPREILTGTIADETGRIRFTSWEDTRLREEDVVRISGATVRPWRGIPQLNFDGRAEITKVKGEFPSVDELSRSEATEIRRLIEGSGAADVTIVGSVLQVREGTGLIFRCPECKRVLQKGTCRIHGKVDGIADLRVKAVIDDGTGALSVVFNRDLTEALLEMSIDECIDRAKEIMDYDVVRDIIEERLLARPVEVRGNVTVDDYGPMMIAQEVRMLELDVREKARKLLVDLGGTE